MFAIIRINDTVESSIIYNFVKIQKQLTKKSSEKYFDGSNK